MDTTRTITLSATMGLVFATSTEERSVQDNRGGIGTWSPTVGWGYIQYHRMAAKTMVPTELTPNLNQNCAGELTA